jgi:hypothetical protein
MPTRACPESSGKQNVTERQQDSRKEISDRLAGKLFTFTIEATGQVVKLETVDANGTRQELSDEEKAGLAQEGRQRIEEVLEAAFEAGIDCVLGEAEEQDETEQSDEDAELRHLLLVPLMKHGAAKRLLRSDVLDRAILGALIQHAVTSPSAAPVGAAPTAERSDRATSSRAN